MHRLVFSFMVLWFLWLLLHQSFSEHLSLIAKNSSFEWIWKVLLRKMLRCLCFLLWLPDYSVRRFSFVLNRMWLRMETMCWWGCSHLAISEIGKKLAIWHDHCLVVRVMQTRAWKGQKCSWGELSNHFGLETAFLQCLSNTNMSWYGHLKMSAPVTIDGSIWNGMNDLEWMSLNIQGMTLNIFSLSNRAFGDLALRSMRRIEESCLVAYHSHSVWLYRLWTFWEECFLCTGRISSQI